MKKVVYGLIVLLAVIHQDFWWWEAVVQIRHLEIGQPVKVDFNAYPFDSFKGEVTHIGRITLSDLAISKSDLSDNRVRKLTQRIPMSSISKYHFRSV